MIALLRTGLDAQVTVPMVLAALRAHAPDVPGDEVERLAAVLTPYLASVPDALDQIFATARDPRCTRAVTFAAGTVLAYLFDEEDLLPEARLGLLGLLDDAYLVHTFADELSRTYPFAGPSAEAAGVSGGAAASHVVARLLPEGVADALLRTGRSTLQVAQALFPSGPVDGAALDLPEPNLRVQEAATSLEGLGSG
ncbi:DUF1232 domain-containing protein [Phycicoccus sp. HDW14]|uniref:DUF1232 domain-containing protein n=1 Tax=Phycicoccus sp. HDW14 TaxID=2714941 RepID=UPI00140A04A3|nr:DUF1232 domain-containing protein [Phycicoccus sp. HDW14]QIM22711.1 DUF1232 domain-containing protein [Phycicoccus sp. HDW14]